MNENAEIVSNGEIHVDLEATSSGHESEEVKGIEIVFGERIDDYYLFQVLQFRFSSISFVVRSNSEAAPYRIKLY